MKILIAAFIAILLIATACSGGDDLSVTTNQVGFPAGPTTTTESDEADSSEAIEVSSEPAPVTTEPTATTAAPVTTEPPRASDSPTYFYTVPGDTTYFYPGLHVLITTEQPPGASNLIRDRLAEVMPRGNVVYLDGINPEDIHPEDVRVFYTTPPIFGTSIVFHDSYGYGAIYDLDFSTLPPGTNFKIVNGEKLVYVKELDDYVPCEKGAWSSREAIFNEYGYCAAKKYVDYGYIDEASPALFIDNEGNTRHWGRIENDYRASLQLQDLSNHP